MRLRQLIDPLDMIPIAGRFRTEARTRGCCVRITYIDRRGGIGMHCMVRFFRKGRSRSSSNGSKAPPGARERKTDGKSSEPVCSSFALLCFALLCFALLCFGSIVVRCAVCSFRFGPRSRSSSLCRAPSQVRDGRFSPLLLLLPRPANSFIALTRASLWLARIRTQQSVHTQLLSQPYFTTRTFLFLATLRLTRSHMQRTDIHIALLFLNRHDMTKDRPGPAEV